MKIVDLNPVLFREYDLRGIVGELIDEDVAYTLGVNYGSYVQDLGIHMVVIGHDNRKESPLFASALIKGITSTGCGVVDLGEVTTPMFYFARYSLKLYAGIMVTASHNPKEYNGFKISFNEIGNAYGPYIQDFYKFCVEKKHKMGEGTYTYFDIKESYLKDAIAEYSKRISRFAELKIIEIKEIIVNFYDTAKVDDLFDGKTLNMLESFKSFNKSEGILVSIFSILLCFIMSVLTYQFISSSRAIKKEEDVLHILFFIFINLSNQIRERLLQSKQRL